MDGRTAQQMRESTGATQREGAALVGKSANTIARRERGELPIDLETEFAYRHLASLGQTILGTGRGARRSQPATVDRGTPSRVAMVESPVCCTSWTRRWSWVR